MIKYLRQSFSFLIAMTVLVGILYPLAITAAAQTVFPHQANGSLIVQDNTVVGSDLIGQNFTADRYFHGRPSAAGKGHDGLASGGSNYGPLNPDFLARVQADADRIRTLEALESGSDLPSDSVLASASGLDPHVSLATALMQIPRIAEERSMAPEQLATLVSQLTEKQLYGIPQSPQINVLKLNLALDALK